MGSHETYSTENEWYTPKYIFDALECEFDMDVAAPQDLSLIHVPAKKFITSDSLTSEWSGFIWCNPPWAGVGNKQPWIDKAHLNGTGLLLTPDRTSAPWWRPLALKSNAVLFTRKKIKFIPGPNNHSNWKNPGNGTSIHAFGEQGIEALLRAQKNDLGIVMSKLNKKLF